MEFQEWVKSKEREERGSGRPCRLAEGEEEPATPEVGGGGQCPGPRSHHLDDAPLHGGDRGYPGGAAALRGGGHVWRRKGSK